MKKYAFCAALLAMCCLLAPTLAHAAPPTAGTLDEPLSLSGSLSIVIVDDFARGRASTVHALVLSSGRRIPLEFTGAIPAKLRTGMTISVSGRFDGERLSLKPAALRVLGEAPSVVPSVKHKVLTVLMDLVDGNGVLHAHSQTCDGTTDLSADLMFGTKSSNQNVDELFQQSSYDRDGMGGMGYPGSDLDVVRIRYTDPALNVTNFSCTTYGEWAFAVDQLLAAGGVRVSDFEHRAYLLPLGVGCTFSGQGEVDCVPNCRSWAVVSPTYPCSQASLIGHELGHNLGMRHASSDTNNDGVNDGEYGDSSDFMASSYPVVAQSNAPHRLQMNWIPPGAVVDGSAGGTFTIAALELASPAQPQVIRVNAPSGPPYYLSFRAPIDYDAQMPNGDWAYLLRTNIHRWAGGVENSLFVAAVADNETYTAQNAFFTLTQLSHTATTATFRIDRAAGSCTRAAPTASMSPTTATVTVLPASKAYTLTLTNRDSSACTATSFAIGGTVPGGWGATYAPTSLSLAPGASATSTVTVSVPAGVANATYAIQAGSNADANHALVRASANLVVNVGSGGSCTVATPTTALSPASQTTTVLPQTLIYTLTVSNKDSAACPTTSFGLNRVLPSGWTGTLSPTSLSLAPGASATSKLTVKAPSGALNAVYAIKAGTKIVGSHAASQATASAEVNVGGGGGSDTTPPTTPANLAGSIVSGKIVLSWSASTDAGSGLANYTVYRNGAVFATTTSNSLSKFVGRGTASYYVVATDKVGNVSAASNLISVTK